MILVVDADLTHRHLLVAQLREEDVVAEGAPDPETATALCEQSILPVAGVVYVSPPAMPGAEPLEILARLAERAFLVVIASAWQREAWEAMGWPRLTVIPRPVSVGQVVEVVKAVAQQRSGRRPLL